MGNEKNNLRHEYVNEINSLRKNFNFDGFKKSKIFIKKKKDTIESASLSAPGNQNALEKNQIERNTNNPVASNVYDLL